MEHIIVVVLALIGMFLGLAYNRKAHQAKELKKTLSEKQQEVEYQRNLAHTISEVNVSVQQKLRECKDKVIKLEEDVIKAKNTIEQMQLQPVAVSLQEEVEEPAKPAPRKRPASPKKSR